MEKSLAQVGYEAYAAFTGGLTFDGRPMPTWANLTPRIQEAWKAATDGAIEAFRQRTVVTGSSPNSPP